jgi:thiol-disulfide isomerase/thioredoxin
MRIRPSPQRPPGRRPRRLVAVLVAGIAALALAVTAFFAFQGADHKPVGTSTSPTAFVLPKLDGSGQIRLSDFRGKPLVVNFFASWCSACNFELPGFAQASLDLAGQVTFVGVDSLETGDPTSMTERHHITWWPLARDVGGAHDSGLHDALGGGSSMPITAFYDADGHVLKVQIGAQAEDELRATITQLYHLPTG